MSSWPKSSTVRKRANKRVMKKAKKHGKSKFGKYNTEGQSIPNWLKRQLHW